MAGPSGGVRGQAGPAELAVRRGARVRRRRRRCGACSSGRPARSSFKRARRATTSPPGAAGRCRGGAHLVLALQLPAAGAIMLDELTRQIAAVGRPNRRCARQAPDGSWKTPACHTLGHLCALLQRRGLRASPAAAAAAAAAAARRVSRSGAFSVRIYPLPCSPHPCQVLPAAEAAQLMQSVHCTLQRFGGQAPLCRNGSSADIDGNSKGQALAAAIKLLI